jgi:anti-sigma regulatory factor (Ser/Thr protein kinase)
MIVVAWLDEDDHLAVLVCDEGHGLLPRPRDPGGGLGLGLGLMAQMADDFAIANREDRTGTIVSLRFALARRACRAPVA